MLQTSTDDKDIGEEHCHVIKFIGKVLFQYIAPITEENITIVVMWTIYKNVS